MVSTGFLGGAGSDAHAVLATDSGNNVYVGGYSSATWGTPKRSYSALSDGVLTKVSVPAPAGITVTPTSGLTVTEAGGTAQFSVVLEKTVRELQGTPCLGLDDAPAPNQQIMCSRSFGEAVTRINDLREVVSQFAARVAGGPRF